MAIELRTKLREIKHGITKLMVWTVDTDFIFLLLVFMPHIMTINNNIELFCDFGTDKHRKVIMVNPLLRDLTEDVYLAIPFFHSFTGCDSTTSFYGISKRKWTGVDY